ALLRAAGVDAQVCAGLLLLAAPHRHRVAHWLVFPLLPLGPLALDGAGVFPKQSAAENCSRVRGHVELANRLLRRLGELLRRLLERGAAHADRDAGLQLVERREEVLHAAGLASPPGGHQLSPSRAVAVSSIPSRLPISDRPSMRQTSPR